MCCYLYMDWNCIFIYILLNPYYITPTISDGFTQVYGRFRQTDFGGPYSGGQCTSISTAAGIMWLLEASSINKVTPTMVNRILVNGNKLHYVFKEDMLYLKDMHSATCTDLLNTS